MSGQADKLLKMLSDYDFNQDEAKVYLSLLKKENLSALALSKELKIPRTRVYRILEKLISKGFVKEQIKDYGTKFAAVSYEKFENLLNEKEKEILELKKVLPELYLELANLKLKSQEEYKVLYYRGVEGLKQVTWNSLNAKGLFRIYEINDMNAFLDKKFTEKVRLEFVKREIKVHQLTNFRQIDDFTDIFGHVKDWTPKYVNPLEFEINFKILIYNDVYCMYSYDESKKDIFCVEIYNSCLAKIQKQMFDFIWSKAKPIKTISKSGKSVV